MVRALTGNKGTAVAAFIFLSLIVAGNWPASWWMTVTSVEVVGNPREGKPIRMVVDRKIKRNFVARWDIAVRVAVGSEWEVECTADGTTDYRPTSRLPDDLDLAWWTNGKCPALVAGAYQISTVWTIQRIWPLPPRKIKVVSRPFSVGI